MAVARGQITITDLNDAKTVNLYLSANQPTTQIFNQDGQVFVPSWTGNDMTASDHKLVITPQLLISGATGTPKFSAAPTWKLNGTTVASGDTYHGIGVTIAGSTGALNYDLTLNGNMVDLDLLEIVCEGNYLDTTLGTTIPIKANITFSKSINTGQLCMARIDATGHVFKEEATGTTPSSIVLNATLVRGSESDTTATDSTPFSVQWQKRDTTEASGWKNLITTAGKWTVDGRVLTVFPDGVDSESTFRCIITDTYSASATYNSQFPATFTIIDMTDPFSLVIRSSNGDTFKNGNINTTLSAQVQQGGLDIAAGVYTVTYTWAKYNSNGARDTSFDPGNVQQVTITSSDVTSRATFECTATIA